MKSAEAMCEREIEMRKLVLLEQSQMLTCSGWYYLASSAMCRNNSEDPSQTDLAIIATAVLLSFHIDSDRVVTPTE